MSNFRIGYQNYADLATLTASPIVTAAGAVTFLQSDARGDICQATSTASQDFKLTWGGAAVTIAQLTLWRHNLLYSDTIREIFYPNLDWTGSPLYDPGASAAYASGLFDTWGWGFTNRYFAPVTGVKSAIIRVAASAASLRAARLYLGPYVEAPFNPVYGFVPGRDTNSKQSRSEGASLRSLRKGDWRTQVFDMIVQTEADYTIWDEIGRYCGTWGSFVSSLNPGVGGAQERNYTLFGKFEKHPGEKLSGPNQYDFSMKILEL